MTDRATLLANVLAVPSDDTARLVLADWLEENEEVEFGRFVRAGVLTAQFQARDQLDDPAFYELLRTIAEVTLNGTPARWLSALGIEPSPLTSSDWMWDNTGDRVTIRIGVAAGVFTRGLLSELIVPLEGWYDFATPALSLWPLERGIITDMPGLSFWIEPPDDDQPNWRLIAAVTVQTRRRRRGLLNWFGTLLGPGEDNPRPVPVNRRSAERSFPDRAALIRSARDAWPVLLNQVRAAADANS